METTREGSCSYVVYFTKGLADVVVSEVTALAPRTTVSEPADRFALISADASGLTRLQSGGRTFDDIRLLVAGPSSVPDAASFGRLCAQAAEATRTYLSARDPGRADSSVWSVTMSARVPSWRRRPSWDPSVPIAALLGGADLQGRSRAEVDLRIQADGDQAHISVNLTARPHGKREQVPVRPGALRPSVAAALVRLALQAADPSIVSRGLYDPCCGTGTIPAEAARLSVPVYASDIDAGAVTITANRLTAHADRTVHANRLTAQADRSVHADRTLRTERIAKTDRGQPTRQVRVFCHDLLRGIPHDVAARIVASNLPWDKQVSLPRQSELFDAIATLTARGIAGGGASVLLTTSEQQLVGRIRRQLPNALITSRRIGLLGQTPTVVVVRGGNR
jgi:hypothetical protein